MGYERLGREILSTPLTNSTWQLSHSVSPSRTTEKKTPRPTSHARVKRRLTVASPMTIRGDPTTDSDYPKDFVCFLVKRPGSAALRAVAILAQRVHSSSVLRPRARVWAALMGP
jgi:hypothetical protein